MFSRIFKRKKTEIEIKNYSKYGKIDMPYEISQSLENAEKELEILRLLIESGKNNGFNKHRNYFNLNIYLSISYCDIVLLLDKIRVSENRLEKLLYSRILSMIIYEFLDDINKLLGKDFIREIECNGFLGHIEQFKSTSKMFSNIKNENAKILKSLRNNTVAHKETDGIKLINSIYDIDSSEIYKIGANVVSVISTLNAHINMVLKKILDNV